MGDVHFDRQNDLSSPSLPSYVSLLLTGTGSGWDRANFLHNIFCGIVFFKFVTKTMLVTH